MEFGIIRSQVYEYIAKEDAIINFIYKYLNELSIICCNPNDTKKYYMGIIEV